MNTETRFYQVTQKGEHFLFSKNFLIPNLNQPPQGFNYVAVNYNGNKYRIESWEYDFINDKTELKVYILLLS